MPREAEGPLCLGAYFNLGLVEQRLGKPRSALRCFEAAQRQANATLTLTQTVTLTLTLTLALTLNPNPGQANALDLATPAAHEAEGAGKGGPSHLSQAGARQLRMATEARRCREM